MTNIAEEIRVRGIREVLHFTTHFGLTGVLATRALQCKDQLKVEQYLYHILKINTQRELDPGWSGYVHMSISRINTRLFGISEGAWHQDLRWRILSFDPVIMTHPQVHFVTTNNAYVQYDARHKRGMGVAALRELFCDTVHGRYSSTISRPVGASSSFTTCEQAEVMYPGSVSTDFLRKIYVKTEDDENEVAGQLHSFGLSAIEIVVQPDKFQGM